MERAGAPNLEFPPEEENNYDKGKTKPETAKIYNFPQPEIREEGFRSQYMKLIATDGQEVITFYQGIPTRLTPLGEGMYLVEQKNSTGEIIKHKYGSFYDINGEENRPERKKKIAEIIQ